MKQIFSIHDNDQEILLETGHYKIDVLGGWGVEMGSFSISFIHKESGQIVYPEQAFLKVQSRFFEKRAKRIFTVSIVQEGLYKIKFKNPESLQVKNTALFFSSLFQQPISNNQILIYIHQTTAALD